VIVEDKGSGEKNSSTARPKVSAASVSMNVSAATPSTPPTTTTIFGDEDLTIAQALVKKRSKKAMEKEKGFVLIDKEVPPILNRSSTTLQPLLTINPKDKVHVLLMNTGVAIHMMIEKKYPLTQEMVSRILNRRLEVDYETYDGEINLAFDKNLISNEFTVKLCLDYEMKKGKKLVKKELIVALKGELYFMKFIINPEEDDFKPGVILERSFMRLAHRVVDFGNGVITIYPKPNLFEDDSEKTGKS
ncbi:hypothetical protein Tco_0500064, partial [Tanacetum coccineum]